MAKCLVTGGAGFIGSWVVDALIEEGHEVMVIDNLSTGKKQNLNPKAQFWYYDISDRDSISGYSDLSQRHAPLSYKPDYIFHLAALARIQPSIDNPLPSHETNLTGTLNVLELCRMTGAKLIFSSSSSLYDGSQLPSKETSAVSPTNPYTLQKMASESYIELYNRFHDVDSCILRYFNVFGERQILTGAYAAVVGIFLKQKREGNPLTITGNGEQRRDFTYVKDVARANVMAMHWQGYYNIGSGKNYSVNQLADKIGGERKYLPKRQGEVEKTLADITKAKTAGWEPSIDIMRWLDA